MTVWYSLIFLMMSAVTIANDMPPLPKRICPTIDDRRWNVADVTSRKQMNIFCDHRMRTPLKEMMRQGAACELHDDFILCGKKPRYLKICVGIPGIGDWTLDFNEKHTCVKTPLHPLSEAIPPTMNCMIRDQGILCLPREFDIDIVFPIRKPGDDKKELKTVVIDDLKCPPDAEAMADFDKVYCTHRDKVSSCENGSFLDNFDNQKACKLISAHFVHVWFLKE